MSEPIATPRHVVFWGDGTLFWENSERKEKGSDIKATRACSAAPWMAALCFRPFPVGGNGGVFNGRMTGYEIQSGGRGRDGPAGSYAGGRRDDYQCKGRGRGRARRPMAPPRRPRSSADRVRSRLPPARCPGPVPPPRRRSFLELASFRCRTAGGPPKGRDERAPWLLWRAGRAGDGPAHGRWRGDALAAAKLGAPAPAAPVAPAAPALCSVGRLIGWQLPQRALIVTRAARALGSFAPFPFFPPSSSSFSFLDSTLVPNSISVSQTASLSLTLSLILTLSDSVAGSDFIALANSRLLYRHRICIDRAGRHRYLVRIKPRLVSTAVAAPDSAAFLLQYDVAAYRGLFAA
ncbi:hypothetical protein CDD83_4251 [Cordyceps sp. RAO-2017]|nr:hypothetical protein CDD83_4251 [Cordyceps sp. RAO-2017]